MSLTYESVHHVKDRTIRKHIVSLMPFLPHEPTCSYLPALQNCLCLTQILNHSLSKGNQVLALVDHMRRIK